MKNNHVAKHAHKYNKSATHVDRKKLDKLKQPYNDVEQALQEVSDIGQELWLYDDIEIGE